MALTDQQFADGVIMRAIETAVRAKVAEIAENEIKAAQERVELLIKEEIDRIALNLLTRYDIANHRDELVITFKKF